MAIAMTKRLLLILAVLLFVLGAMYVAFGYLLGMADSYPSFMADYQPPRSYADLDASFDQFVTRRFPVGSDTKEAVATIGRERFRIVATSDGGYRFAWARHAGPCGEHYGIVVRENSDGTIAEISGWVRKVCL